jgi:hypothetical protein
MGAPTHSGVLENRGKNASLWALGVGRKRENNGISRAKSAFQKTGVWHRGSKNANSHEKSEIAMVFTPSNNPDFCSNDVK